MHDTEDHSGLSRRTVLAGAAWTVPAVVATSALPAYAASTTNTTVKVSSVSGSGTDTRTVTVTFSTNDGTEVKAGTEAVVTVSFTGGPSNTTYTVRSISPNWSYGPIDHRSPNGTVQSWSFTVPVKLTTGGTSPLTATFSITGFKTNISTTGTVGVTSATAAPNNGSMNVDPTTQPL